MSTAAAPASPAPAWVKILAVLVAIPTVLFALAIAITATAGLDGVRADRNTHASVAIAPGAEVRMLLDNASADVVTGPDGEVSVDDRVDVQALTHDLARRGLDGISTAQLSTTTAGVEVRDGGREFTPFVTRVNHRLTIHVPSSARIVLRSTNGAAHLTGVTGAIDIEVTNGAFDMTDVTVAQTDRVIATNGAINIDAVMAGGALDLTSENGAIHVNVPRDTSAQYDLASLNGAVFVKEPGGIHAAAGLTHSLTGQLGSGDLGVIRARTTNGAIAVEAR